MADVPDGRQKHMIAAVYHLVKALEVDKNPDDDTRKLLEDLDHFSAKLRVNEGEAVDDHREVEARLVEVQRAIVSFHSNYSNIWDSGAIVASDYLRAVAEVEDLIRSIESLPLRLGGRSKMLLDHAESIRQIVMVRLEKEVAHILMQNKHCFEQDSATPPQGEALPAPYEESVVSNEDESVENVSRRESSSTETEEYTMDLIHPDVVPQLRSLANAMFTAGYGHEFCRVFTGFWRDTLAEYLTMLDVDHFSIEDVLRMEWKYLNFRIKNWCLAVKRFIGAYLGSAKRLFDQVLGEQRCTSSTCLIEAAKPALLRLLNFGQAVSIGPHGPEWLYCLLNMYEALEMLISDIDALFPDQPGSLIRTEFHELLEKLGKSAKIIFQELGMYIASSHSTTPYPNGGIHPLTRYIMNYILCISGYGDTLNSLLQANEGKCPIRGQCESDEGQHASDSRDIPSIVALHLQSWTSILEANLEERSNLYKDIPLKHIFMLNNIHYMVHKISKSKISAYFGEEWIKSHMVKYRQHATAYQRGTWGHILPLLLNDGKTGKAVLKARCREFASAFDEMYKNQTRWSVPDVKLREELRIAMSNMVIPAYRNFVSRVNSSIGEKHVKYTEQELGSYILDLLECLPKSLNHLRKK